MFWWLAWARTNFTGRVCGWELRHSSSVFGGSLCLLALATYPPRLRAVIIGFFFLLINLEMVFLVLHEKNVAIIIERELPCNVPGMYLPGIRTTTVHSNEGLRFVQRLSYCCRWETIPTQR